MINVKRPWLRFTSIKTVQCKERLVNLSSPLFYYNFLKSLIKKWFPCYFTKKLILWRLRRNETCFRLISRSSLHQASANNSTSPCYSKNISYSANTWGQIVGRIVVRYSTRPQVEYLYFRQLWPILSHIRAFYFWRYC